MTLKLVSKKSKKTKPSKIEIDQNYRQKIGDLFLMPEKVRAALYNTISFSEVLSIPFKKALSKDDIKIPTKQQKLLAQAGYYDLIVDYLTLSALNDQEKKYLFEDLNRGTVPFFFKIEKVVTKLKKIKTPLTPFTIQETHIKHAGKGSQKIKQEVVKKECIKLTRKGKALLLKLCPNLQVFKPVLV